ncbi:MAG: hypothetical protein OEY94_02815 [Alphaproteobacteria bacterium]|nr:hypothetical protein [Alphaproteobacteria bacterium]
MAGGGYHSCGIKSDDTLWCWGRDFFGQLGDDFTYADKSTPVIVADGATWKTVAAGSSHTCGIKSDDTLWCWGRDLFGQLGDGGLALNKLTPSPVTGGATWKAVAAGGEHSCGIKSDDTLWCWGADSYGQLGDDATLAAKLAPVIVAGGATWKTVTGGGEHSCGIKSDDTLWCWGSDIYGGLGDSIPTVKQPTPVAVAESDSFLSSTITYKTSGTTKGGASPWTVGGASFAMTTGDALMVCIATLGTVTGVTWNGTALTLNAQNNATVPYYSVYSLPNVTGATGDLVLTMSGTITAAVTAYSVTNLTSAPFDKQSGTTGTSTTPSSTAATTTQANEFLFGCIAANGPEIDGTWDAPFSAAPGTSAIATSGQGAASNIAVRTGYATVTATGSYLASMTGITSRDWAAAIATYKNNTNPVPCSCTWPVGSGTGCTSYGSCSTAAQMNYDATNGMLWCDGTNWRGMKAP